MSTEDSSHSISPTPDELALDIARLRQQLASKDEKFDERLSAAVAEAMSSFHAEDQQERRQYREALDALTARNAALTHELQIERRDAHQAARDRSKSRYSGLHSPMPVTAFPQSTLNFDAQPATESAADVPEKIRYKQPPMFSAIRTKDQMTFDNWQYAFRAYCEAMQLDTQTNPTKCIKLAVTLFAPEVARWYYNEYERMLKPSPITWAFFVQCVMDKYEPVPIGFTARTALKSIRQTGTIEEYNAAFNEVISRIDDMAEADKVDKYIDGLKQALRVKVASALTLTLLESMTVAVQLEAAWATTRDRNAPAGYNRNNNRGQPAVVAARNGDAVHGPPLHLGRMSLHDHKNDDDGGDEEKPAPPHVLAAIQPQRGPLPKLTDAERARLLAIGGCFRCRKTGHMARECPDIAKNY
jgi:hypothetical protein